MKRYLIAALSLFLITGVEAAKKKGGLSPQVRKEIQKEEQQKKKEKAEREKRLNGVQHLLDAKDTNHDGSLSRDEYLVGEKDAEAAGKKFDEFNKNKDRYLSKGEIAELLGL